MKTYATTELCPGCGAQLPATGGPAHRYPEASASRWYERFVLPERV